MSAGSIIIDLLLRTGSFSTDAQRSAKDLEKLKKEAQATGRALGESLKSIAAAAGITLTVAGIATLVQTALDAADSLGKLAQKSGVSAEALSALKYAGDLSGVSIEALAGGLGKLARSMSEAARGGGDQAKAFEALGISVKNVDGSLRPVEKVLDDIADKFEEYADGAEKTALAQAIFGKTGAEMIPLLNSGAAGLKGMREEAEKLGIVMSGELTKAAEQYNDTITKIKTVSQQFGIALATQLLPALQAVADEMLKTRQESGGLVDALAGGLRNAFQALTVLGANFVFVWSAVGRELGAVAAQLVELPSAIAKGDFTGFRAISEAVKADGVRARAELDAFERRVLGIADPLGSFRASQNYGDRNTPPKKPAPGMAGKDSGAGSAFIDPLSIAIGQLLDRTPSAKLAELNAQFEKLMELAALGLDPKFVEEVQRLLSPPMGAAGPPISEEMARINDLMKQTDSAKLKAATQDVVLLNEALSRAPKGTQAWLEIQDALFDANEELTKLSGTFGTFIEQTDMRLTELAMTMEDVLGASFALALEGSFKDIGRMWQRLIIDMAARAIAADLMNSLFGKTDATGKRAGGGMVDAALKWFLSGSAKGNVFSQAGIEPFANGGVVNRPTVFPFANGVGLMGEAGPEAILPLRRGSDGKLGVAASGGGGVTVVNHLTVAPGVSRNEVMAAMEMSKQQTIAALADMRRRGREM